MCPGDGIDRADAWCTVVGERCTMIVLQNLPQVVAAIGGLGTAAFGLVDASKVFGGGVNHIGFAGIRAAIRQLTDAGEPVNALSQKKILATLQANWMNGTHLGSQKAIAKSLIKLNLNPRNARRWQRQLAWTLMPLRLSPPKSPLELRSFLLSPTSSPVSI